MIIHHGQLVVSGPVAELRRGDRPRLAVRVTGDGDASWAAGLGPATGTVDAVRADGTAEISITSGRIHIHYIPVTPASKAAEAKLGYRESGQLLAASAAGVPKRGRTDRTGIKVAAQHTKRS